MERIKKLYDTAMQSSVFTFEQDDLNFITAQLIQMQQGKSIVASITGNCVVIGDIHGMLCDLQQYFWDYQGKGIVLLGDYVDRGPSSYECFLLAILRLLSFPEMTIMLRGNHETREMCLQIAHYYTLEQDIIDKYAEERYAGVRYAFITMFDYLNIYAVINGTFLCVHGCIPSFVRSFAEISELKLPCVVPATFYMRECDGILQYMSVWCDWLGDEKEYNSYPLNYISYRGARQEIRLNAKREESGEVVLYSDVSRLLDLFKFAALFRGHVYVIGLDQSPDGRIFTLYGHQYGYSGAMVFTGSVCVEITEQNELVFHVY